MFQGHSYLWLIFCTDNEIKAWFLQQMGLLATYLSSSQVPVSLGCVGQLNVKYVHISNTAKWHIDLCLGKSYFFQSKKPNLNFRCQQRSCSCHVSKPFLCLVNLLLTNYDPCLHRHIMTNILLEIISHWQFFKRYLPMKDSNFQESKHVSSNFASIPQHFYVGKKWHVYPK